ncbi:MAG TPA: hypothetical protein DEF09_12430 [Shigella sp.]|nr:hypothetical protein [Shigella sp.]
MIYTPTEHILGILAGDLATKKVLDSAHTFGKNHNGYERSMYTATLQSPMRSTYLGYWTYGHNRHRNVVHEKHGHKNYKQAHHA